MNNEHELPPLPNADYWSTRDDDTPLFTADQMHAHAAAAVAAAVPQWRPIETAPDGVMLLFADMKAAEARHWAFCGWRHNGLRGNAVQMPDSTARSATHWMPLPAAPEVPR